MKNKDKPHPGNIILTVIAGVTILGAFVCFILYLIYNSKYEETNDAQIEAYINPISARVGGYIEKVMFEEHQLVKGGDTIVTIYNSEYLARVQEAQAAVQDARAQLTVLGAGIRSAEAGTLVNQNQISGANARFGQQQQEIRRYEKLLQEEAVTGSDYELVKSRFEVAESDLEASKNNLKVSNAKIDELRSRTAVLEADLQRKLAILELAKINLSYTVITAPYSGRMGRKTIMEGQQIQPGQPLVLIVNEDKKWVTANFKETQVSKMYVGQPVNISVDAIDGKVYTGEIEAIAGSTGSKISVLPQDNSTGNFVKIIQRIPVKIKFTSDISGVKAGMNATVAVKRKNK